MDYDEGTQISDDDEGSPDDRRISKTTMFLMVGVALLVDTIQAVIVFFFGMIPFIGAFIGAFVGGAVSIVASIGFYVWYKRHDVSFLDKLVVRKFLIGFVVAMLEIVLSFVPSFAIGTFLVCLVVRLEDRIKASSKTMAKVLEYAEKFV